MPKPEKSKYALLELASLVSWLVV